MELIPVVDLIVRITGAPWGAVVADGEATPTEVLGPAPEAALDRLLELYRERASSHRGALLAEGPAAVADLDPAVADLGVSSFGIWPIPGDAGASSALLVLALAQASRLDAVTSVVESLLGLVAEVDEGAWYRLYRETLLGDGAAFTVADARAPDQPLLYVSDGFSRLTGYPPEEVVGRNCRFLQADDRRQPAVVELRKALDAGRACIVELRNYRRDGGLFYNQLGVVPVRGADGGARYFLGVQRDVTALREAQVLTERDRPTGLANQAALLSRLATELSVRMRGMVLGLVLIRSDDFEELAGAIGDGAVDQLFGVLARRLERAHTAVAGVFRFEADTFGVLLETDSSPAGEGIATTLVDAVTRSVELGDVPLRVEAEAGAVWLPGDETPDVTEVVRRARVALREARERPGGCSVYCPAMDRGELSTLQLLGSVGEALERGEFELHYQRKVDLRTDRFSGAEALVRWRRDGRLVAPGSFLPRLEQTRLIADLARFVIDTTLTTLGRNVLDRVAINLAARNVHDEPLVDWLLGRVREAGGAGSRLQIEITESAVMTDLDSAVVQLRRLRDAGLEVHVDDFGTGHASYAYLQRLPVTALKIDRAFVAGVDADSQARALVGSMVDAGHALGLEVIAEGVETASQAATLATLGCEYGQGFHWHRPVPEAELIDAGG